MLSCFIDSWLVGLLVAAPIGPVGILCIKKTLEFGFIGAVAIGIGVAFADSIYGLLMSTGMSIISSFVLEKSLYIKLIGGILLILIAAKDIYDTKFKYRYDQKKKKIGKLESVIQGFVLTLMNPVAILSFIGIYTNMGCYIVKFDYVFYVSIGVFAGSISWWMILGFIIVKAKKRLSNRWIERIRIISVSFLMLLALLLVFDSCSDLSTNSSNRTISIVTQAI